MYSLTDVQFNAATARKVFDRDARTDEGSVRIVNVDRGGGHPRTSGCPRPGGVEVDESSVSHSLRLLRTAGIVRHRRAGRQVFYSLDDAHVRLLLDVSVEHVRHATST